MEVREFTRLTPLSVDEEVVDTLSKIRDGDGVIAFSRRGLYDLKEVLQCLYNYE